MSTGPAPVTICLAFLGAIATFLPWMEGTGSAMTLNLRDLAEWCSLNPASRNAWLPLGTSLGLRLLPVFLLAMFAWRPETPPRLRLALSLLAAIALLPPPEHIVSIPADANTQQQAFVALLALLCGPAGALRNARAGATQVMLAGLALLTAILSMASALDLQRSMGLDGVSGAGAVLYVFVVAGLAFPHLRKKRGDPS